MLFSFQKDELPSWCRMNTSVLDDWMELREFYMGQPPLKRMKQCFCCCLSDWPYKWDWNGLFCHDFPLLQLPATVLLETLKLVDNDSRRELSFTCQKMRRLIVKNKTPSMDRRRCHEWALLDLGNEPEISFTDGARDFDGRFEDFQMFEEYLKREIERSWYKKLRINIIDCKIDYLSKVVEALDGFTAHLVVNNQLSGRPTVDRKQGADLLNVFMKYPTVKKIAFDDDDTPVEVNIWTEYCNTVSQWTESNGIEMKRRLATYKDNWGFVKEKDASGKEKVIMMEMCGWFRNVCSDYSSSSED